MKHLHHLDEQDKSISTQLWGVFFIAVLIFLGVSISSGKPSGPQEGGIEQYR
jgi:hypothetical protein